MGAEGLGEERSPQARRQRGEGQQRDLLQEEGGAGLTRGDFTVHCMWDMEEPLASPGRPAHLPDPWGPAVPFAAILEGGRDTEERLSGVGGSGPDTGPACQLAPGPFLSQRVGVPSCADSCVWPGRAHPGTPGRSAEKGEVEIGSPASVWQNTDTRSF